MKKILLESAGYAGASLILLAYFLVSFGLLHPQGWLYQTMNLAGSAGNIAYYFHKKAYSGTILDGFWLVIALIALIRLL